MADSREIGMRTGAAMNQAVQLTVAGKNAYGDTTDAIKDLAADLAFAAGDLQDVLSGGVPVHAANVAAPPASNVIPFQNQAQAAAAITEAFPGTTTVAAPAAAQLEVIGQQGPLPAWLLSETAQAGCTKVYDNRDGLAENPKRPWFKAADDTVFQSGRNAGKPRAFRPPRGD